MKRRCRSSSGCLGARAGSTTTAWKDRLRWRCLGGQDAAVIDLGRLLLRGAERDARWIRADGVDLSPDGTSTYGVWLERIS